MEFRDHRVLTVVIEPEITQRIDDGLSFNVFYALQDVSMLTNNGISTCFDVLSRSTGLGLF